MPRTRTGREIVMETLVAEGVEYLFGNPGTTELPLIDALEDHPSIRYVLTLQEAIAVSMAAADPRHYETGARIACALVRELPGHPLPGKSILNVNVPDLPLGELRGLQVTRLGHRHRAEPAVRGADADGAEVWRVGAAGPDEDGGAGTDFHAVRERYASVTPLQVDLTRHQKLEPLRQWVRRIPLP